MACVYLETSNSVRYKNKSAVPGRGRDICIRMLPYAN